MSEQLLPTSPHPNCPLCANPDLAQYVFENQDGVYSTGEIVILQESVHEPIQRIFNVSSLSLGINTSQPDIPAGLLSPSYDSLRAQAPSERTALTDITWPSNVGLAPKRPAIIWPSLEGEPDDGGHYVCLMTGYRGARAFAHLPGILHYFCMPISPHDLSDPGRPHDHHLHTHPEWQKKFQWFIAYPFVTQGHIHGRWCWNDAEGKRTSHAGFRLTQERLAEVDDIWTQKFEEWTRKCAEDPGFLEKSLAEYQAFKDQSRSLKTSSTLRATFTTMPPPTPPTIPLALPVEITTSGLSSPVTPTSVGASPHAEGSSRGRRRGPRKRGKSVQLIKRVFNIGV